LGPNERPKAGLDAECGRGSPPAAVRVRGYHPRKIFENSDAKSCILVTTMFISGFPCCEISCFLKTTARKLGGGPIHLSSGPYGCCVYVVTGLIEAKGEEGDKDENIWRVCWYMLVEEHQSTKAHQETTEDGSAEA